jgi:hypothetical protein
MSSFMQRQLIRRLREWDIPTSIEAANEIERLQRDLENLMAEGIAMKGKAEELRREAEIMLTKAMDYYRSGPKIGLVMKKEGELNIALPILSTYIVEDGVVVVVEDSSKASA